MRIVHLELAGFYTEKMLYQTNLLARYNRLDGHDVTIVSTNFHWEGSTIVRVPTSDRVMEDGIHLIRLAYANPDPDFHHQKFRRVLGLLPTLEMLTPDVILIHCTQFWSVQDVIRYKQAHPEVKLYADTHTAAYNSGMNWLSLHILHRIYYKWLTRKLLPYLDKYFYIGENERLFSVENYGVPEDIMEYFPLGGLLFSPEEYADKRQRRRKELGLAEGELLLVHTGKLEAEKRTDELLRAFAAVPELHAKLAIMGSLPEDRAALLQSLMDADERVVYLGWKQAPELMEYLCACDLYCQPGGTSATMQNAICCGSPVLSYPHLAYTKHLDWGNFLWIETQADMEQAFRRVAAGEVDLTAMRQNSECCAHELLDYRKLAARLYN